MKVDFSEASRIVRVLRKYPPLILAPFATSAFLLSFIVLVVVVNTGNTRSFASGSVSQTVSWSAVQFRQQVCLAGTTICQAFKTTTSNSATWTLPSLVAFDLHVQISSDGANWYGWENQNNTGINCYGPANCSKTYTWAQVDYIVYTNIDNTNHKVTNPTTSYTYASAPAGFTYSGTVSFRDFDNFGNPHTVKNLSGTTTSWVLNPSVVNGSSITFSFSPASNGNAVAVHVIHSPDNGVAAWDSGPINSGSSIIWNGAPAGSYSASLVYGLSTLAGPITFTVAASGGTPAVMNPVVMSCNSGLVNANFSWQLAVPPAGYTIDGQKIQIGVVPGTYWTMGTGVTTTTATGMLQPGTTYYWRILAHLANTGTPGTLLTPPSPAQVVAPKCAPVVPTGLSLGAMPTCSDTPYSANFIWQGSGANWYVDISQNSSFSPFSNKAVPNITSTNAPSGFNPAMTFNPNTTYYWRVWNGAVETNGPSFSVKSCTSGGGTTHSQTDIDNYLHSNTKYGQTIISANCNGATRGNCANGPSDTIGRILYGIAGGESSWTETIVGGTCSSGPCYGLLQFDLPVFNGYAAKLSATTGKTYSWNNAYDQLEVAYYLLMLDPSATAYQISTQWYPDSIGTPFLKWQVNAATY